jgi:hypothetical protein
VFYWENTGKACQCNKIDQTKNPKIDQDINGQVIVNKVTKAIYWGEEVNWVGKND